jgi:hypothetical protein
MATPETSMNAASRLVVNRDPGQHLSARPASASGLTLNAGPGDPHGTLRQLQRLAGNRSVNALLRQHASTPSSFSTFATVQRTLVQREDPPDPPDPFKDPTQRPDPITGPGGPGDTNDKGFTFGIKNGKWGGSLDIGKGDPLDIPGDWSKLGPSKPDAGNIQGPGNCPPGMYNKMTMGCCKSGTHADASGWNCVADSLPTLPPAAPVQPGDYNVPDPNAPTQVA